MAANPDKGKTEQEKEDMSKKYKPGDDVLPKVSEREKTLRERRVEDEDRRLMDEVRNLSLREVGVESPEDRRERRRREEGRSRGTRSQSSRENSRDNRQTEDRERRRRREEQAERRRARDDSSLRPDVATTEERRRRRSDEEARRRHEETSRTAARQIEHQSSLRSLISSDDVDSHEMEEEILRQIREEGLLDGIDLENIDVNQEDQISERIAEAFRRRQSERARQETSRRSDASARRRHTQGSASVSRETSGDESARSTTWPATRRRRAHSRTPSSVSQSDEPSRPPPSMSAVHAAHLDVHSSDEGRRRRRASSGSRSATTPVPVTDAAARPIARSQHDLNNRPQSASVANPRPVSASTRSSTDTAVQRAVELPAPEQITRASQPIGSPTSSPSIGSAAQPTELPAPSSSRTLKTHSTPTADVFVPASAPSAISQGTVDRTLLPAPLSPRVNDPSKITLSDRATAMGSASRPTSSSSVTPRTRPELFPEPSLTCARCAKPHIEYELHYNCRICSKGDYNICLSCYRSGLGCLYWFGFGYAAWKKWERLNGTGEPGAERPHMLTANRYIPPKVTEGGADGRRTLTTDDPYNRLQSGAFCASCEAWANECYWRCETCNEGDWGFCNLCVNQGKSCTHALLPLTYKPTESENSPLTPTHDQQIPPSAKILTGPGVIGVGDFKPLTFDTTCDILKCSILPSEPRYHCFHCRSKVPNTQPGDYDICTSCYPKQVASRRISAENGQNGWRRCPKGHRMVIVGFEDSHGGQRRVVMHDLVGGRGLVQEPSTITGPSGGELQQWSWGEGTHVKFDGVHKKLVTTNVMETAPTNIPDMAFEKGFPPDGGVGMKGIALWSWYPAADADDELMFPKGAEIRECKDVNKDWFHGTYMGKKGLFPAPYVMILDHGK